MNRKGDMDESDQAKINFANAGHAPQVLRTKTLVPPTFTLIASPNTQPRPVVIRRRQWAFLHRGSSYILSLVQPKVLQVLCVSGTGQAFEWRARARARCDPEILELAWVVPEAGWRIRVGVVQRYVVVFVLGVGV